MQRLNLTLILGIFYQLSLCQNISFDWVKLIGQDGRNELKCMVMDTSNNIIAGGYFENTIAIGDSIITSNGDKDFLLAKYDSSGNNIWVIHGGGDSDDYISDITFLNNRLFVVGIFSDTIYFEDDMYIADSLTDLFIGELVDDKIYGIDQFSGKGLVRAEKLFADNENLYINGGFEGEIIIDSDTIVSTGHWEYIWPGMDSIYIFHEHLLLAKYHLQDKVKWYKNYENARSLNLTKDISGNLYMIAKHYGNCIIENEIEITDNLFLVKYNENGDYIWHITGGPPGQITQPYDIVFYNDALYLTGHIAGDDLYIGDEIVVETSWYDAFVCKMDTSGSLVWFYQIGNGDYSNNIGPHSNYGNKICISNDTIFVAGHFLEEIDFGTTVLNSLGAFDLFFAKFSSNGSFIDAGQYLVEGWSSAHDILVDNSQNIYLAGYSFEENTSSNQTQFMLLGKVDSLNLVYIPEINLILNNRIELFPNPTNACINLKFESKSDRNIYVINTQGEIKIAFESEESEVSMDVSFLIDGLYQIIVQSGKRKDNLKFIKINTYD